MAGKEDGFFTKDRQPEKRRGKSKRVLILEAIRDAALLEIDDEFINSHSARDINQATEKKVFEFLANSAFQPTEQTAVVSNTCLNHLMKKGWPDLKPVEEPIDFELPEGLTLFEQCEYIMQAVSKAKLPVSSGTALIGSISQMIKVQELTDINERLKELEKKTSV